MTRLVVASLMFLSFCFSVGNPSFAAEDSCAPYKGVTKIWWEGAELKNGQIGKLTVLQDTSLYKLEGTNKIISKTLKKNEVYRIYAFKPGMLSVGGGYYIDRDNKVEYKTPSKAKLAAVQCIHNPNPSTSNAEKQPAPPTEVPKQDVIMDPSKSHFQLGYPDRLYLYDVQNYTSIPYSIKGNFDPFQIQGTTSYIYSAVPNILPNQMYSEDIYRISVTAPYQTVKVLEKVLSFKTDGTSLYFSEPRYGMGPNGENVLWGWSIYKANLDGTDKTLVTDLPNGLSYNIALANDGFLYLQNKKYDPVQAKYTENSLVKISTQTGEIQTISNIAEDTTLQYGFTFDGNMAFYFDNMGKGLLKVYSPSGELLYSFDTDRGVHEASIYNGKLYCITIWGELYEVQKPGIAKKLKTYSIATSDYFIKENYLYIYDINKHTIQKEKIVD